VDRSALVIGETEKIGTRGDVVFVTHRPAPAPPRFGLRPGTGLDLTPFSNPIIENR
jgi:hypothetical protein